ncbi:MAG: fasciclin domain-containing protein, partial [Balneolales bacterium]|nr:fasciclin domain-containing protein [Balneolales bacterium]
VTADVDVSNGVIHAVDEVLLPNAFLDITQIASKNYDLSTLVSLLDDNDLVSTLQGDGPFTVFAPTNTAFANAASVLDELTSEQVAEVLTYHVVTSKALSGDLSDGQVIPSFQGENITVAIDGEGNVTLNGSVNVTTVDLEGTNGVIHIIDAVILPPSYQN